MAAVLTHTLFAVLTTKAVAPLGITATLTTATHAYLILILLLFR